MKKDILISLFLLFNIILCFGQKNQAVSDFQKNAILQNASIGFLIQDMNGKEIASYNKKASLTPASILKVVTTATALETLGSNFMYETKLSYDGKNIIVSGEGDPTLGSEYLYQNSKGFLTEWINQIQKTEINKNVGIYIKDDYFGYQGTSRKWIREDMGNYYAAGSYGISIFDNTYRLYFNTTDTSNPPKIIRTEPQMTDITFLNTLTYNNTGQDNGYIWGEPFSNQRMLIGNIPSKRTSFSIKGDIPDPGLYLGQTLANMLKANGFTVNNISTSRNDYYSQMHSFKNAESLLRPIHTDYSPTLKEIIRIVNVKSNNHYTEHLIRTLGRFKNKDIYSEPLKEGIEYTSVFWQGKGISTSGLFMYDGCGLSPSNAVNAELMCNILRYMSDKSRFSSDFLASLPRAGIEGTVRNVLKDSRLSGKVYMKSGSIAGVQSYAGYYINGNEKYTFTIIVNKFNNKNRRQVIKAIETLLLDTLP